MSLQTFYYFWNTTFFIGWSSSESFANLYNLKWQKKCMIKVWQALLEMLGGNWSTDDIRCKWKLQNQTGKATKLSSLATPHPTPDVRKPRSNIFNMLKSKKKEIIVALILLTVWSFNWEMKMKRSNSNINHNN